MHVFLGTEVSRGKQTLTFISGVIFSRVWLKQIISSSEFKGLKEKKKNKYTHITSQYKQMDGFN